ncbi:MAG: glycosyltransferase family 39 protein, partial [Bacteroidota bacterium]
MTRTDASSLAGVLENLNTTPYDKYQPIYFILLFFWRQLFGDSATVLRSLSALFGTLSVVFTTLTALKIYGEKHAVWTCSIVSISAFHVYYSQEIRAYPLVLFFAALELYLFSGVFSEQQPIKLSSRLLFWLCVALGCLSSIFIFVFTASICVAHLLAGQRLKYWLGWWLPILLCILPAIGLYSTSGTLSNININTVNWLGIPILQNFMFVVCGLLAGTT